MVTVLSQTRASRVLLPCCGKRLQTPPATRDPEPRERRRGEVPVRNQGGQVPAWAERAEVPLLEVLLPAGKGWVGQAHSDCEGTDPADLDFLVTL